MTTEAISSSQIFHDSFTYKDEDQHNYVTTSVLNGETEDLPQVLQTMDPASVTAGAEGTLSSGTSATGEPVYFAGYVSDEGQAAITSGSGKVAFYFNAGDEGALISALQDAGLIPANVTSFAQLGSRAIGVIENAVDNGILSVNEDGQLSVSSGGEDSAGPVAPTTGASHVSETDESGGVTGEASTNDSPQGATGAAGTTSETGATGATGATTTSPVHSGVSVTTAPVETAQGSVVVKDDGAGGFKASLAGGAEVDISPEALAGAGLDTGALTAQAVVKAFAGGKLGFTAEGAVTSDPTAMAVVRKPETHDIMVGDVKHSYTFSQSLTGEITLTNGDKKFVLTDAQLAHAGLTKNSTFGDIATAIKDGRIRLSGDGVGGSTEYKVTDQNNYQVEVKLMDPNNPEAGFMVGVVGQPGTYMHLDTATFMAAGFNETTSAEDIAYAIETGQILFKGDRWDHVSEPM